MSSVSFLENTSLGKIFNLNPVAMLLVTTDHQIERLNSAFCKLSGYDFSDLEGHRLSEFSEIEEIFNFLAASGADFTTSGHWTHTVINRFDGEVRNVRVCLEKVWDESRKVTHWLLMLEDIEHRLAIEKAWESQQEQLRTLTQKVIAAQEEERRRIARELHDEWGQLLSSMKIDIAMLENASSELCAKLEAKIDRVLSSSRQLSRSLRPSLLDQQGLQPALQHLVGDFERRLSVTLEVSGLERRFAESVEITAFRLVQESLTNIRKHADAEHVKICVGAGAETLHIEIIDNGRGFDPEHIAGNGAQRGSAGVTGMTERVNSLGGRFQVFSRPGYGTRVRASLPVEPERTAPPLRVVAN